MADASTTELLREVLQRLTLLQQAVDALSTRRSPGARDDAERRLLEHLARLGRTFTASAVWQHRLVDQTLADVLECSDIDSPRSLGKALRRLERATGGDVRVVRVGCERDGVVWRCCEFASVNHETRVP